MKAPAKKLPPFRELTMRVYQLDVSEEVDRFDYASDNGHSYREPMQLCLKVQGNLVSDGTPVYFTHRLKFCKYTGLSNGNIYSKDKTDFFEITEEEGVVVKSSTPELFPNALAIVHRAFEKVLIREGDELELVARCAEKTSKAGRKYLQLSHVSKKVKK